MDTDSGASVNVSRQVQHTSHQMKLVISRTMFFMPVRSTCSQRSKSCCMVFKGGEHRPPIGT